MIRKHIARALRAEQRSAQLAVHRPAGQPAPAGAPTAVGRESGWGGRLPGAALAGAARLGPLRVGVHDARQHRLVEAAPVHADAHRLVVAAGELDDGGELRIALGARAYIAGVDAKLG